MNYRFPFVARRERDENPFLISISDLMAGLLSIFMLALAYYVLSFGQQTAKLTENEEKREEILEILKEELQKAGIIVRVDKGVLHLPEGILFDVGEAEIKEEGWRAIKVLAPVLGDVLRRPQFVGAVETVFIEGHTDNAPINTPRYPSNWELSTQRAINTWNAMQKVYPELGSLTNKGGQPLFSCSGYADTRPIAPNDTAEGKQANRRIDLRFTITPPEKPK